MAVTHQTEHKSFVKPEEVREFPHGQAEIVTLGGGPIGRLVFEPGWRWSNDVKPIAKTDSCEAPHFQYHVSGRLGIRMDDGEEFIAGPGDLTSLPSGHDAWVVGDEPVVVVDFYGASKYAKPPMEATMTSSAPDVVNRLLDGVDRGDTSIMDEVFHDDAVMEWPASRERVVGAENRRAIYAHMPVLPKVSNRHVFGSGDLWVAEVTLTYGDKPFAAVLIFQMRDGKIAKETGYWAEPFEAPEWRRAWVKPLDLANRSS